MATLSIDIWLTADGKRGVTIEPPAPLTDEQVREILGPYADDFDDRTIRELGETGRWEGRWGGGGSGRPGG